MKLTELRVTYYNWWKLRFIATSNCDGPQWCHSFSAPQHTPTDHNVLPPSLLMTMQEQLKHRYNTGSTLTINTTFLIHHQTKALRLLSYYHGRRCVLNEQWTVDTP